MMRAAYFRDLMHVDIARSLHVYRLAEVIKVVGSNSSTTNVLVLEKQSM